MNKGLLRKLVKERNDNSVRFAAINTGLTETTLRNLLDEEKEVNPSIKTLQKIANYYGVPVADLIEDPK